MLRSMRHGVKSPVMKVFLLFLAAGFALWGVGDMSGGLFSPNNKAVQAGDQSVSVGEAAMEFERTRISVGAGLSTGDALQAGLLNEVMGGLARQTLYRAEADSLGITVTREMQKTTISREPAFRDEQEQFSDIRFRQALAQAGYTEQQFLDRISQSLVQEQIEGSITIAGQFSQEMSDVLAAYQLEQRTATLRQIDVADQVVETPSEAELIAFFEQEQTNYDAPALRKFEIVHLSPERIAETIILDETELRAAFELRRDEFITPERRKLRQMVFDTEQNATEAFAELAHDKSFDAVAAEKLQWSESDTNLGLVSRSDLTDDLSETVFAAAVGVPSGPIKSAFGYHVFLVDEIQPGSVANFAEVKDQIADTLIAEKAIDTVYDHVNQLEDILGTGASLLEAAAQLQMAVGIIENIDRNGRDIDGQLVIDSYGDLASDSVFLQQAWEQDIDTISTVVETADDSFFVVRPTSEANSRSRSLDEIRDRLVADWTQQQALQSAMHQAERLMTSVDDSLAGVMQSGLFRRNGSGLDHAAAGLIAEAAFAQPIGSSQLVETGSSVIIVRTDSILVAKQTEQEDMNMALQNGFNRSVRADIASALSLSLSETHELELNPALVQQILVGQTSH